MCVLSGECFLYLMENHGMKLGERFDDGQGVDLLKAQPDF